MSLPLNAPRIAIKASAEGTPKREIPIATAGRSSSNKTPVENQARQAIIATKVVAEITGRRTLTGRSGFAIMSSSKHEFFQVRDDCFD